MKTKFFWIFILMFVSGWGFSQWSLTSARWQAGVGFVSLMGIARILLTEEE